MWRVAAFSGVQVLTYAVMDNHFHMLIKIPERKEINEGELLRRLALIYRDRDWDRVEREYERVRVSGSKAWMELWMKGYTYRMYNLAEFMKTLKLRYTIWYNKQHGARVGTLWSDRFRSVLIEPLCNADGRVALALVAAYIELNAVRAGLVDDPKGYVWCGYRDALAGHAGARAGIATLMGRNCLFWRRCLRLYRGWWRERLQAEADGWLKRRERGFSYGVFLGGRSFVDSMRGERVNAFNPSLSKVSRTACH